MIEKLEHDGSWYIPGQPGQSIPGRLVFTPDEGAKLTLYGSFHPNDRKNLAHYEILLGMSFKAEPITLLDCYEMETRFGAGGIISILHIETAIIGIHFERSGDIRFRELSVNYSNLNEWVGLSGFKSEERSSDDPMELVIRFRPPDSIHLADIQDYRIFIDTYSSGSHGIFQRTLKQSEYIRIESLSEKTLREFTRMSLLIQNFLTLAVGAAIVPENIKGGTEADVVIIEGEKHYRQIEIVQHSTTSRKELEFINPYFMLFRFADVRDRIHVFLSNWFQKAESLKPVYDLYFATLYNPDEYLQSRFLSYVQAIETYHRKTKADSLIPEERHEARLEMILKTVPEDCRTWLKKELEYSNRPRLRRRLKELLMEFPWVLGDSTLRKDINAFVNAVVATRNYLTHYNELLEKQAAKDEDLYRITLRMQSLLEICLLKEMGFGPDEIRALVETRNKKRPW